MARRNRTEVNFARLAGEAGFMVMQPRSIRIEEPVNDKNGVLKKIVTSPDFYVVVPDLDQGVHVEVTNSSGDTPHKQAQQRVVDKAGVTNYVVVSGEQIKEMADLITVEEKYRFLIKIFSSVLSF